MASPNSPALSPLAGGQAFGGPARPSPRDVHVAFEHPMIAPAQLSELLTRRLQRSRAIRFLSPVRVEVVGDTAVLCGVVAEARDRRLAELLVGFEAGIRQVKNDLVVAAEAEQRAEPR